MIALASQNHGSYRPGSAREFRLSGKQRGGFLPKRLRHFAFGRCSGARWKNAVWCLPSDGNYGSFRVPSFPGGGAEPLRHVLCESQLSAGPKVREERPGNQFSQDGLNPNLSRKLWIIPGLAPLPHSFQRARSIPSR